MQQHNQPPQGMIAGHMPEMRPPEDAIGPELPMHLEGSLEPARPLAPPSMGSETFGYRSTQDVLNSAHLNVAPDQLGGPVSPETSGQTVRLSARELGHVGVFGQQRTETTQPQPQAPQSPQPNENPWAVGQVGPEGRTVPAVQADLDVTPRFRGNNPGVQQEEAPAPQDSGRRPAQHPSLSKQWEATKSNPQQPVDDDEYFEGDGRSIFDQ